MNLYRDEKFGYLNKDSMKEFWGDMLPGPAVEARDRMPVMPQERQRKLFEAAGVLDYLDSGDPADLREPKAPIVGYGGAAFGGKTYGILLLARVLAYAYPGCQMAFFRRTYAEMDGPDSAMSKAYEVFNGVAKGRDSGKHFHFHETGSDFYFRHCEYEKDRHKYQSQDVDFLFLDEATHFTWVIADYLITRNRVTSKVDRRERMKPFTVLCSNPGNVGHAWYMQYFDLEGEVLGEGRDGTSHGGKEHEQVKKVVNPNGKYEETYFIPAFMEDNKIGLERDPEYPDRLERRDPALSKSLRLGDWTIFAGQKFRSFDKVVHVWKMGQALANPGWELWPKWCAMDLGFEHEWYAGWYARDVDTGRVIQYREASGKHLTVRQQARIVQENTPAREMVNIFYAGHDYWTRRNVDGMIKTAADEMLEEGIPLTKADTDRVSGVHKVNGMLAPLPDGMPGLVFTDNCPKIISILPKLAASETNVEDVQKVDGDDPYDTLRYALTDLNMFQAKRETWEEKQARLLEGANDWSDLGDFL